MPDNHARSEVAFLQLNKNPYTCIPNDRPLLGELITTFALRLYLKICYSIGKFINPVMKIKGQEIPNSLKEIVFLKNYFPAVIYFLGPGVAKVTYCRWSSSVTILPF